MEFFKIHKLANFWAIFTNEKSFLYIEIIFFRSKFGENSPVKETLLWRIVLGCGYPVLPSFWVPIIMLIPLWNFHCERKQFAIHCSFTSWLFFGKTMVYDLPTHGVASIRNMILNPIVWLSSRFTPRICWCSLCTFLNDTFKPIFNNVWRWPIMMHGIKNCMVQCSL